MNATKIDCEFSGSTACVAFLEGCLLNVAWVGDSRGVLGRRKADAAGFEAVNITVDHKPTNIEEQARIIASSGRVERYLVLTLLFGPRRMQPFGHSSVASLK